MRLAAGFGIKLGVVLSVINFVLNQGCVLFSYIWIIFMDFVLKSTRKALGEHRIIWQGQTFLDSDCTNDLKHPR